ncbi:alpha/beta fold hydrolase [Lysobacter psychrotolerans]|uniref:Alpha/beta hydrolase n=1 Tax=Montanilutibacter psychrotolerans TaxID=1327343 RepID=A0A3M8SRG6_9GAMM|nr:alpha/beta hydrolase [Lysobacter psychrotolerans]
MRDFVVDTGFGRMAGLRGGSGRRVLALHGWLDNAASFVPLQPLLEGVELVAVDLPGHGASAHLPHAAEFTMVSAARACFEVADALGWERFDVLGHSLGASIASVMAAACPHRIERLCAIEALGALVEAEERSAERLRTGFAAQAAIGSKQLRVFDDIATAVRARMQANGLSEPVARLLVERGIAPVRGENDSRGFSWRSDPRLTTPTLVRMSEGQVRDLLRGIQCPVRVVYATPAQSYFPEPLRSERVAQIAQAELVVLDGSHHLHMEDPVAVAAAIGTFLSDGFPSD